MLKKTILFLILNFLALGLGSIFTSEGVPSEWYQNLNQAPWTPPGWMFGVAWLSIMICFAFYMAYLYSTSTDKKILTILFVIQWVLNIGWNIVFFHSHQIGLGLLTIIVLTLLMGLFLFKYWYTIRLKSILVLPYFVWLLIATSLNGYIFFTN